MDADEGRKPTARQAALVDDTMIEVGEECLVENAWTGMLHKSGRQGFLACRDRVGSCHAKILHSRANAAGETFGGKPVCWPPKRTARPLTRAKRKAAPPRTFQRRLKKMVGLAR